MLQLLRMKRYFTMTSDTHLIRSITYIGKYRDYKTRKLIP